MQQEKDEETRSAHKPVEGNEVSCAAIEYFILKSFSSLFQAFSQAYNVGKDDDGRGYVEKNLVLAKTEPEIAKREKEQQDPEKKKDFEGTWTWYPFFFVIPLYILAFHS